MQQFADITNGSLISLIVIVLLVLFTAIGLIRGFAKTFISVFGKFLSILFAVLLCALCVDFLEEKFALVSKFAHTLEGTVESIFGAELANTKLLEASERSLTEAGVAKWIAEIIIKVQGEGALSPGTTLKTLIAPIFAYYIIKVASVIVLYILFRIIFHLIGNIVVRLKTFKLINVTDRILGLLIGFIHGMLILNIAFIIINVVPISFFQNISVGIETSPVASFFSKINMFDLILQSFGNFDLISYIK